MAMLSFCAVSQLVPRFTGSGQIFPFFAVSCEDQYQIFAMNYV